MIGTFLQPQTLVGETCAVHPTSGGQVQATEASGLRERSQMKVSAPLPGEKGCEQNQEASGKKTQTHTFPVGEQQMLIPNG
jgi:hypothetical protein